MKKIILGKTGLEVTRTSFGALPIQRLDKDTTKELLLKAYDSGVNFFDTARAYSDSEEKIGYALSDVRKNIIIATKTHAKNAKEVNEYLETSLRTLKTDYIDLYQIHNPKIVPTSDKDVNGIYEAVLRAKEKGYIRHIGITQHSADNAHIALDSGLYETLQFPFSCISHDIDIELAKKSGELNIGFIAMKALCGGLISNVRAAFAFLRKFENVVPIWGIQHIWELEEILRYDEEEPKIDKVLQKEIDMQKIELSDNFCRGCGYCMPCSVDIQIPTAARMKYLLGRAVWQNFTTDEWKENMKRVDECTNCGLCITRCPYNIDTPRLLKEMKEYYDVFIEENIKHK